MAIVFQEEMMSQDVECLLSDVPSIVCAQIVAGPEKFPDDGVGRPPAGPDGIQDLDDVTEER